MHSTFDIYDVFSDDDFQALRKDLETLGMDGWENWAAIHQADATTLISRTPKQREKHKGWKDPVQRRRLAFLAHRLSNLASIILNEAEYLDSSRDSRAFAAGLCCRIIEQSAWRWPFSHPAPKGWQGLTNPKYQPLITVIPGAPRG